MPRDPEKYLFDMRSSADFLLEITAGRTLDDYGRDRAFRGTVERELQNIGEALIQLRKVAPKIVDQIAEHDRIIRFRHVLVHGYDSVNPKVVWHIVTNKLPVLTSELQSLLSRPEHREDQRDESG